jgi:PAS domain S-box-containing protein
MRRRWRGRGRVAALRASEERDRAVVENQTEMVSRFQLDGTLLFVNASYAQMLGQTPDDLVGANFWSFIPADQQARVRAESTWR